MNYIKLYHDLTGAFVEVDNDIIVGRSHLANKLQLITPITLTPETDIMQVYFVLANGQITPKRSMTLVGTESYDGDTWNVYEYAIPSSVLSIITGVNANTIQVQFRHARLVDGVYTHILACEMDTLTINAGIVPADTADIIYVDEYDDLLALINGKQYADWAVYSEITNPNDTDYITIANGSAVSNKITVANLISYLQADYSDLDTRVTTLEVYVDQDVSIGATDIHWTDFTTDIVYLRESGGDTAALTYDGTRVVATYGGISLEIGENNLYIIKASAAITEGQVIQFAGTDGASGKLLGKPAVASEINANPSLIMGIATDTVALNADCRINAFGQVNIDSQLAINGTPSATGILYYDSTSATAGKLTYDMPVAPNVQIEICALVYLNPAKTILQVRPSLGNKLSNLHDVYTNGGLSNHDILKWSDTNSRWESFALFDTNGIINDDLLNQSIIKSVSFAGTDLTVTYIDDSTAIVSLADLSEDASIIASGTVVQDGATWYMRFTRADASTFDIDVTSLIDDTNLITSVNGQTGVVVLDATDVGAEPTITKNTAFNKDFGTIADTVAEGNHTHDFYTQAEVDALIAQGSTTIKEQRFIITNADNGDGTFSYTWLGNPLNGTLNAGVYTFALQESVEYIQGQGRIQAFVNNDVRYASNDPEFTESTTTSFSLEYAFQVGDDVNAVVYQGLDTVSIEVGADSITRVQLAQAVEDDIDAGLAHIATVTGNPHEVTKTEVGLGNVDNTSDLNKPISTATQTALDGKVGSTTYTTTIATTDTWTDQIGYFTLAKTVSGLVATDEPIVDLDLSSATVSNIADIQTAWGTIYRAVTSTDTYTFYALEEPTFPEDTVITIEVIK